MTIPSKYKLVFNSLNVTGAQSFIAAAFTCDIIYSKSSHTM